MSTSCLLLQGLEDDDLVDPVDELRPKLPRRISIMSCFSPRSFRRGGSAPGFGASPDSKS